MALTFVQRIKELLTGKRDIKSGVRLVINCEKLENRVALLDKGVVEEYNIERVGTNSLIGSVFKGRIRNIEQGLKAMFIDIGFDKNAFLHFWDAIPAALDAGLEEINRGGSKKKKRIEAKDIPLALDCLEGAAMAMIERAEVTLLLQLIARLPQDAVAERVHATGMRICKSTGA